MSTRLIRGRIFSFTRAPSGPDDEDSYRYHEDGAVLVRDGRIVASGEHAAIAGLAGDGVPVDDHRPCLITAGLIDAHLHMPQMQMIASWGATLLDWLERYTFVEEQRFADPEHCRHIARCFLDELIRCGTTTVAAYCSVHPQSAEALFEAAAERDMRIIAGKVMMDRNAPAGLLDTAQASYDDTRALIGRWHKRGRALYAITPRFAITSTPAQLQAAGALAREYPDCHVQTHLGENHDEIAFARRLYPDCPDYAGIYERYGLLGPRSLLGHCIHLTRRERQAIADSGAVAVFCPTSNLFLGSGLFDRAGLAAGGVRVAVATDIGAGTSYSMLRTLDEGYKVLQLRGEALSPLAAFDMMTRGNAEALSLAGRIGTLDPGCEADLAVFDSRATPAMRLRMERAETLAEELFVLQTLGDDRAVRETYVAGRPVKSALAA